MLFTALALCGLGLSPASFEIAPYMLPPECPEVLVYGAEAPVTNEKPAKVVEPAKRLVELHRGAQDGAGYCLRYAQTFFGTPAMHRSAWLAWEGTEKKFDAATPLPKDVPVVLWFEHWGTYVDDLGQYGTDVGNPYYGNWGHVAAYVPGEGVYTSPKEGVGSELLPSIQDVEQRFEAKYVGWSLDLNTTQVSSLGG